MRFLRYLFFSIGILGFSLVLGMAGYHYVCGLEWVDSLLNASMILTGMGPVYNAFKTNSEKLFASFYAIYSGLAFLGIFAVIVTPALHRFMHVLHLEESN